MQFAVVENNHIVNVVLAEHALLPNWEPLEGGPGIGWWRTAPDEAWMAPNQGSPAVPDTVARWQAVRALRLHSDPASPERTCLATVQALREAATEDAVRADIEDALLHVVNWRRQSPTLEAVAQAAGWTPEFVDELFVAAAGYDL